MMLFTYHQVSLQLVYTLAKGEWSSRHALRGKYKILCP